jgi:hypothetical protein
MLNAKTCTATTSVTAHPRRSNREALPAGNG